MTTSEYSTKHAFLAEASSPHTLNLILNLLSKQILKRTDIVLILYGNTSSEKSIVNKAKLYDLEVLIWNDIQNSNIQFLSLNPFSLLSLNAGIINDCIEKGFVLASNIHFLMQDDEIDRWNKIFSKHGKLVEDESAFVDSNVINILNKVDTYIVPYNPWGATLEKVVGRRLKIIDAVIPFSIIDYDSQEIFDSFLEARKVNAKNNHNYKILLFTKPMPYQVMVKAYISLIDIVLQNRLEPSSKKITISIWFNSSRKNLLMHAFLLALIAVKKPNIDIELNKTMTHEQYLLTLHEYDCLVLQARGGFSAAKYFAEKVGKVITLKNSFNDQSLKQDYNISTFNYKNIEDALIAAIASSNSNQANEINKFASKMTQRHNESYSKLEEFWANVYGNK